MSETPIQPNPHECTSRRPKYDNRKLPTPPPDPKESKSSGSRDKYMFEYLESILSNYSPSNSLFAPVVATEEALDHLEKLYKLMEQMLLLRDQNAKLYRRIRDLEYLNNLENIYRHSDISKLDKVDYTEIDADSALAASVLETILIESARKDSKGKLIIPQSLMPSVLRKNTERKSSPVQNRCKTRRVSKVSKWTKVKAAFKWEKASTSVIDCKFQDSGIHVPINVEIAKYLRVPSTSEEAGHSPADSEAAGISTPGTLSTASSIEDCRRPELKVPYDDFRSSDDENSLHTYNPHNKELHSSTEPYSTKHSKTPWTKMKDIIHNRNTFKKKQRLSAVSDEIQIDVELCTTDNEDNVFEDESNTAFSQASSNVSPSCSSSYNRKCSSELSQEIVDRYQKAIEETVNKKESRWAMVKKAFIPNETSSISKGISNEKDEIRRHYKLLQKKIRLEFQEKFLEWERLKQHSPGVPSSPTFTFGEDTKDPNFIRKMEELQKIKYQSQSEKCPMPTEFHLPPGFKKKLEEWEKIKKSTSNPKKKIGDAPQWKSLNGHKSETSTVFEYPVLSDEFRRKLEEWKHIKAGFGSESKTIKVKTPSPKLTKQNSSSKCTKKIKDPEKEIDWFEKELGKIEKEKQSLEREKQKFQERKERLSRIRKTVTGSNKTEVQIHTPFDFHRFEGNSEKCTQTLNEWEKAQGIARKASTSVLLTKSFTKEMGPIQKKHSTFNILTLKRSKSADSVTRSTFNLACPFLSQEPSSLSLNAVDELESECLLPSKFSLMQNLLVSQDDLDQNEPQAVLVEVEDYEEEMAAPLQCITQKQQLPVYRREEFKTLCAGETVTAPNVLISVAAKAQTNYNLIKDIANTLKQLSENEVEVKNICQCWIKGTNTTENKSKLKQILENQKYFSEKISKQVLRIQDANSDVTSGISNEESNPQELTGILEAVQDISNEILQMAEKMDHNITRRIAENSNTTHMTYVTLFENITNIRIKIQELRRHISYVCAATDLTTPDKGRCIERKKNRMHKTVSNNSKSSLYDTSDQFKEIQNKRYKKVDNIGNEGAIKRRIKYTKKTLASRTLRADTDEEGDEDNEQKKNAGQHRKLSRSRTISDSDMESKCTPILHENNSISTTIVPTETNYINVQPNKEIKQPDSPLTVFVKTTRKLFTPISETGSNLDNEKTLPEPNLPNTLSNENIIEETEKSHWRPLPASPVPLRKVFKDVSPGIKLIQAKYNQKFSKDCQSVQSGDSSGSNSPLWRSPTSERRVKAQTEKYIEDLNNLSPLLGRREVQKCSSIGYIQSNKVTVPFKCESLKENTLPFTKEDNELHQGVKKLLTLDLTPRDSSSINKHCSEIRQKKIQRAKEEFLRSTPVSAPAQLGEVVLTFPTRNRLSQISMESSFDILLSEDTRVKSVSAGMINIDPDSCNGIDLELHNKGYGSLPRKVSIPKANKLNFSNIASKFRKVKLIRGKNRGKEKDKKIHMDTVSTLCRQSLVVDITHPENDQQETHCSRKFGDDTPLPSSSGSNSWIRMSLFKK